MKVSFFQSQGAFEMTKCVLQFWRRSVEMTLDITVSGLETTQFRCRVSAAKQVGVEFKMWVFTKQARSKKKDAINLHYRKRESPKKRNIMRKKTPLIMKLLAILVKIVFTSCSRVLIRSMSKLESFFCYMLPMNIIQVAFAGLWLLFASHIHVC